MYNPSFLGGGVHALGAVRLASRFFYFGNKTAPAPSILPL